MLSPGLIQRQTQSIAMTPQLRQAIEMLQYTQQDLAQYLRQQAEQNPLLILEERESSAPDQPPAEPFDDDDPGYFTSDAEKPEAAADGRNLREEIAQQIRLSFPDPTEQTIGLFLLQNLDETGRLTEAPDFLAKTLGIQTDTLETIRQKLMHFDPAGLFAVSLEECLSAQLRVRNRLDPAMAILLRNLDLLAAREWRKLRELCCLEQDDLLDMLAEIRALDPKPGFEPETRRVAIEPDVIVRRNGSGYRISVNTRLLPKVKLDTGLQEHFSRTQDSKHAVTRYGAEASFLLRALESRKQSLLKIATGIVERQHGFLEQGLSAMRPFTLRELASITGLHESTVSRIVNAKYMDTPRGVFPLRLFFPSALSQTDDNSLSATAIQQRIRHFIANEGENILSDDALTAILQAEGTAIQRRTVAKYREALGIPNSSRRRRLGRTD